MKKLSRVLVTGIAAAALSVGTAGIASADTAPDGTAIWVLPGVDLGAILAPTTAIPGALAPVFDLLRLIGG